MLSEENQKKYNAMVERINALTLWELEKLIADDQCPYDPSMLTDIPLGMFHCEMCGDMVVAGLPHPRGRA